MRFQKVQAFVLQKKLEDKKYADLLLFTREFGKIRAKVRGVQKMTSRNMSRLEPGQEVILELYYPAKDVAIVTHADIAVAYHGVRESYDQMKALAYVYELTNRLLPFQEAHENIYDLLKATMASLHQGEKLDTATLVFHAKLLQFLGYAEHVRECHTCSLHLGKTDAIFVHPYELSLHCAGCKVNATYKEVALDTVKALSYFLRTTFHEGLKLKIADTISSQMRGVLVNYTMQLIEKPLVSVSVL